MSSNPGSTSTGPVVEPKILGADIMAPFTESHTSRKRGVSLPATKTSDQSNSSPPTTRSCVYMFLDPVFAFGVRDEDGHLGSLRVIRKQRNDISGFAIKRFRQNHTGSIVRRKAEVVSLLLSLLSPPIRRTRPSAGGHWCETQPHACMPIKAPIPSSRCSNQTSRRPSLVVLRPRLYSSRSPP